ncbi:hypothetical protein BDR07DRAFT_1379563 [Suillus spraguei]|nr:hypothetical protein BDR07DRAFT_1379563 [Suillus spraguei]
MGRGKGNSSRNPTPEIETTPRESSRSKDSPSRSPALSNDHQNERASSTPNIEAGPSGVVAAHTLSEIRDAQQATKRMHQLSGHATTAVSIGQNAPADLDAVDSFQTHISNPSGSTATSICKDGIGHVVLRSQDYPSSSGSRRGGTPTSREDI